MKTQAEQFALKMRTPRTRTDGLFQRRPGGTWHARFWIGDKVHRKSTFTKNKAAASDALPLLKTAATKPQNEPGAASPTAQADFAFENLK